MAKEISLCRVYDHEDAPEGEWILVDRLWPRGVSKDEMGDHLWLKNASPSDELRKWFDHDPDKWDEFSERYRSELDAGNDDIDTLIECAQSGPVVLMFAAKDTEHAHPIVLRDWLRDRLD